MQPLPDQENIQNESEADFEKNKIVPFSSFESMENDQLKYFASLQPEELLRNHKRLSLAAFGLKRDPGPNKLERKIKFGKPE